MKFFLGLVGILGFSFGILVSFNSPDVMRQIEAGVGVLIGCVCFGSVGIIGAVQKLGKKE